MVQIFSTRLHRRRPGFTLIELVVAMAVVLILGAVAYATYIGQIANARTAALDQVMQQINTAMLVYEANSTAFPTDSTNVSGTQSQGVAAYAALAQDLINAGAGTVPATAAAAGMTQNGTIRYEPINTTTPPTFTFVAQANNGNAHTLCIDTVGGVIDLGLGQAQPTDPGVSCQ